MKFVKHIQVYLRIFIISLLDEFINYFQYCRGLQFEDKPDYNYIRTLLKSIFDKFSYEYDFMYDWYLLKKQNELFEEKNQLKEKLSQEGKIIFDVEKLLESTKNLTNITNKLI